MSRQQRPITDREIKAWLAAGAGDRGVGEGLTFVASTIAAQAGKASWILRYRLNGRSKEKVLGRYPELSLKDAREQVRQDRAQIERGIDVTAAKQAEKALQLEVPTVQRLGVAADVNPPLFAGEVAVFAGGRGFAGRCADPMGSGPACRP